MNKCSHGQCSCPFFLWLELFEKKWNVRLVRELYNKDRGFNELKHSLRGITQGVLSQRLDELREKGIITRKVVKQKPRAVVYSLSPRVKQMLSCWKPLNQQELKLKC